MVERQITIGDAKLWRKLQERYGILSPSPGPGFDLTVMRFIQPVVLADQVLKVVSIQIAELDLTGTAGNFISLATVPDDRMWWIYHMRREPSAGASQIQIRDRDQVNTLQVTTMTPGTAEALVTGLWPVGPGFSIGLRATGNAGDGAIQLAILYENYPAASEATT